jgi:hypothetical protein
MLISLVQLLSLPKSNQTTSMRLLIVVMLDTSALVLVHVSAVPLVVSNVLILLHAIFEVLAHNLTAIHVTLSPINVLVVNQDLL